MVSDVFERIIKAPITTIDALGFSGARDAKSSREPNAIRGISHQYIDAPQSGEHLPAVPQIQRRIPDRLNPHCRHRAVDAGTTVASTGRMRPAVNDAGSTAAAGGDRVACWFRMRCMVARMNLARCSSSA
jgi:hypothetical protein